MNLNLFYIKDEKSSTYKFDLQIETINIGFSFEDGCIVVKFYLILVYTHPFLISSFQLVGRRLGLSPRKCSINRFRGVGWVMGFEGGGVGGHDRKSNISTVQISRGWHLSIQLLYGKSWVYRCKSHQEDRYFSLICAHNNLILMSFFIQRLYVHCTLIKYLPV